MKKNKLPRAKSPRYSLPTIPSGLKSLLLVRFIRGLKSHGFRELHNKQIAKQNAFTEFLLYTTPNGKVRVEIFLRDENLWLPQYKIAKLFEVERSVITKHLRNIYKEKELDRLATSAKIAQVQQEGNRQVKRKQEFS